jgi:6-phosphogluconate dehydrogenase
MSARRLLPPLLLSLAVALSAGSIEPAFAASHGRAPKHKKQRIKKQGKHPRLKKPRGPRGKKTRGKNLRTPRVYRPKRKLAVAMLGTGGSSKGIARRLALGGHSVVEVKSGAKSKKKRLKKIAKLVKSLPTKQEGEPRVVWLGDGVSNAEIKLLASQLTPGDVIVDGGQGSPERAAKRAALLAQHKVDFVDVGVSGSPDGYQRGYGLSIGGKTSVVKRLKPMFQSIAPSKKKGWAHIKDVNGKGVVGGGHMVRRIEGAVDASFRTALREGLDLIANGKVKTSPKQALKAWQEGSILTSELAGVALDMVSESGNYQSLSERSLEDSEWVAQHSIANGMPNLTLSATHMDQVAASNASKQKRKRSKTKKERLSQRLRSPTGAKRARSGSKMLTRTKPKPYKPKRKINVGVIGLGRMGGGVAARLVLGGHKVAGFDPTEAARTELEKNGGQSAESLKALVDAVPREEGKPRVMWMYLPAGPITDNTVKELSKLLEPGDIIVDGGNSEFKHSAKHAKKLAKKGIHFVDVGTSGGVLGYTNGYSLMVGGHNKAVKHLVPAIQTLAPGPKTGWAHIRDRKGRGIPGGGHMVKAIHNAIEYAWMASLAEGLDTLGRGPHAIDRKQVLKVWDERSSVASFLTAVTRRQFEGDPEFEGLANKVPDTGEGRSTMNYAVKSQVPVQVLSAGLRQRFFSQRLLDGNTDVGRHQQQQRRGFGGHQPSRN